MAGTKLRLTKSSVAALEPVPGKQVFYWDTDLRGFGVRVSPGGAKAYFIERRVGRATRRVTIGRCDDMPTEKARKEAERLIGQFVDGFDPAKERKRQEARSKTVREAFIAYIAAPKKKGIGRGGPKKARTRRDIERTMGYFKDWFDKPVTEITGTMVKDRHAKLAETSPAQANLAFRYLRAALNHVVADVDDDEEPILKRNPVDRLNRLNQWAEVKPATRHVDKGRMGDWVDAVQTQLAGLQHEFELRDALLFLLLTGARLAEAIGNKKDGYPPLPWSGVDLTQRTVTFIDTKNRTDHVLPLGEALAAMLAERRKISGGVYVFSDRSGDVPADLRSAYTRIEKATGLHITAHDLRRTFATVASRLDISSYKLKRLTNHISGNDVTDDYIQISIDDLREAMQKIEDHIMSSTDGRGQ